MYNILVIDDDIILNKGINKALKAEDRNLESLYNLESAYDALKCKTYDLIVLDLNLSDGNGFEFLKKLRESSDTKVLILTVNDLDQDIVNGFELGADDYMTKPFSVDVLRARVNNQLKKIKKKSNENIFEIDNFSFNFNTLVFKKKDKIIELGKTEQRLLEYLLINRGITLSRNKLIDYIWTNSGDYVYENAISVAIKRLRDKLEDNPSKPEYIKTVHGIGYRWMIKYE